MEQRTDYVELYNKIKPIVISSNNPEAHYPQRANESDCCFPISIVGRTNNRIDDQLQSINEFTTDMCFQTQRGYFITLYGTDELLKKGYALIQPKIIQPRDTGCIKIMLYKFADSDDLNTPFPIGLVGVQHCANYAHIKKQATERKDEFSNSINSTTNNFLTKVENISKGKCYFE